MTVRKTGKYNPALLDAMAHLLLDTANQTDYDAATAALRDNQRQDFVDVCAIYGISEDIAKALYKFLKDAVRDAEWGWA